MNASKIIYDSFLKPFESKEMGNVGCELEFPLVNTKKKDIDVEVARGLLDYLIENYGFKTDIEENGIILFVTDKNGDCVSYDNSYNNIEFSMMYSDNLHRIKERFDRLFKIVSEYFDKFSYKMMGLGTNPNKKYITTNPVPFSTYQMVAKFLKENTDDGKIKDFPAYLSSVQTHLDVNIEDLPFAYTLFAKLDFARCMLFSNSPSFDKSKTICYRDLLWEESGFSKCRNITGKVDEEFETVDDIIDYFLTKDMFNIIRDGEYKTITPVNIREYFENPSYNAKNEDIAQYLSFKTVEITQRGTLELRGDCQQPLGEGFSPVAFNLGILYNMDEAMDTVEGFLNEQKINLSNSELRKMVSEGYDMTKIFDEDFLSDFLYDLVEIASDGLMMRGLGEEKLLAPLYERAVTLKCPASKKKKGE